MSTQSRLAVLGTLLLSATLFFTIPRLGNTAPTGSSTVYMPLMGRSEPAAADFRGLGYSHGESYMNSGTDSEIYTLRGDGSEFVRLTDNDVNDEDVSWSADGAYILWRQFALANSEEAYSDLWIMNSDGTNPRNLTNSAEIDEYGDWLPDGEHIYFVAYATDNNLETDFYITTPTATTPTLVLEDVDWGTLLPAPDGSMIAFTLQRSATVADLYTANPDGSDINLIIENIASPYAFSWSPDSTMFVYQRESSGNLDLYVSNIDGTGTRRITDTPEDDHFVAWVQDGARLLVSRFVNNANSTELVTLADGTSTPFLGSGTSVLGVSPNGTDVIYRVITNENPTITAQVHMRAVDSINSTLLSPPLLCGTGCSIVLNGWSSDAREVLYTHFISYSPSTAYSATYVANIENRTPVYRYLENVRNVAHWLPYGGWLVSYYVEETGPAYTQLYNTRTNTRSLLPFGANSRYLVAPRMEWRYQP